MGTNVSLHVSERDTENYSCSFVEGWSVGVVLVKEDIEAINFT